MSRDPRPIVVALALCALVLALQLTSPAKASRVKSEQSIAVCAIPEIINELMASDRFSEEREELAQDFEDRQIELRAKIADIGERGRELEEDDPQLPVIAREFAQAQNELRELQARFNQEASRLQAEHLAQSYELVRSSAVAVAEDLGYDFVIASGSQDEELNRDNAQQLLGQLSRRPVLMSPEEDDITEDVRDDLNL